MADEKYYEELHQQFPTFSVERLKQIEEHYVAIAKQMEGQAGFHMTEAEARKKAPEQDRTPRAECRTNRTGRTYGPSSATSGRM